MTSMTEESVETAVEATDHRLENPQRFIREEAFRNTLWSVTVSQARLHSVPVPPVLHALGKLGIRQPEPTVGSVVGRRDNETLGRLPRGSILRSIGGGHRHYYGIDEYREIERLVSPGRSSRDAQILQVVSLGDDSTLARGLGTSLDGVALRRLIEEVRQIGAAAKAAERWCPAYDQTVAFLGVLEDYQMPGLLTTAEVAALPEGTILRSPFPMIRPCIYRRDDSADNPARTVRVVGRANGHWEQTMQVAAASGANPEVLGMWELANAQPGARIDDSGTIWTRGENGQWVYMEGYDGVDLSCLNLMRARWAL